MDIFKDISSVRKYFERDRFATSLGIIIDDATPGYSKVSVDITGQHQNGADVVHGGLTFTLADFAGAVAVNIHGFTALSINSAINYYNPGLSGKLIAEATEIKRTRRLSYVNVKVYDNTQHIADIKSIYYITEKEINI